MLRAYMLTSAASAPWWWSSSSAGSSSLSCTCSPPAASRLPPCAFSRLPAFAPGRAEPRRCMSGSAARETAWQRSHHADRRALCEAWQGCKRPETSACMHTPREVAGGGCVSVRGRKLQALPVAAWPLHTQQVRARTKRGDTALVCALQPPLCERLGVRLPCSA